MRKEYTFWCYDYSTILFVQFNIFSLYFMQFLIATLSIFFSYIFLYYIINILSSLADDK